MKRGVCVAVVLVNFPIIVQRKVKSLQGAAEWDWAILAFMFRISGVAPHLGFRGPIGIPTEVVISHVGEAVIMRLCVRPSLTRDSVNCGVRFSCIVTT